MKQKNLLILIALTLGIVILAAIAVNSRDAGVTEDAKDTKLFPGLLGKINDVDSIEILSGGGTITLIKQDNSWRVKESNQYYANLSKIKAALLGIADYSLIEAKTSKAELYEKLGVDDASAAGAKSTQVTIKDDSGADLASLIIGNRRPGSKPQQYVRKTGSEQSWLVNGFVTLDKQANNWLDKTIVDLKRDAVRSVTIKHKNPITISRENAGDPDFSIENLQPQKKIKSQGIVNLIAGTLENLSLEDVMPAAKFDMASAQSTATDFSTFDGQVIHIEVAAKDDKWYLRLTSEFQAPAAAAATEIKLAADTTTSPDKAEPSADQATGDHPTPASTPATRSPEQIISTSDQINNRTKDWIYVIPKSKAENITRQLKDLVE